MKFEKVIDSSTETTHTYYVNHDKRITLHTGRDHSVDTVILINLDITQRDAVFRPKGLWFLENVTEGENCEILDVDSLMIMIAQEEHGYVRA